MTHKGRHATSRSVRCLLFLLLTGVFCDAVAQESPPLVRVRILETFVPQAVEVVAETGDVAVLLGEDERPVARLAPGERATLRIRHHEINVALKNLALYTLSVRFEPAEDATLRVTVAEGKNAPETRRYPGVLEARVNETGPGALELINHVPLETYVAAVVSREFSFEDLESAKAVAVAVRTYALHRGGKYGEEVDHTDHVRSQAYDGLERLTPTALEAARQTRGEVLTYRGELIEAVFHASSGGHTADNDAVWDASPLPYLRGIPDPYDEKSPHRHWRATVSRPRLLEALSRTFGFEVEGFHLGDRSSDGRVSTIKLLHNDRPRLEVGANEFRLLVNDVFGKHTLKSTFFDARREGDTYVFDGFGFGHGVGLSQYGALEMSRQGHDYREILQYYYRGVNVETRDTGALEEPVATETPERRQRQGPPRRTRRRIGW